MYSPSLTTWRAQYDLLVRSYDRIKKPYKSSTVYNDDLQNYFQNCWHLKDWIKNDPNSGIGTKIESEARAHKSLRIVADLANGGKHLSRYKHEEGAYVTSTNVTVHLGQNKPIDLNYIVTLGDGTTISAQTLVDESFQAWSLVLNKLGLNP